MKKFGAFLLAGVLAIGALTGCGSTDKKAESSTGSTDTQVIKVAASATPHAEILEEAKPLLAKEGYDLQVTVFDDYVQPNEVVDSGDFDANYFQHAPYMEQFNKEKGTKLVDAGDIHYEPFGIYPGTKKSLDEIADGDEIAVPNDTTNEARALLLLESNGLIKLKEDAGVAATKLDIVENPHNLEIVEMEAAQLPLSLGSLDIAVINGNYALSGGLSISDALAIEEADSLAAETYQNVVAVRNGDETRPELQTLIEVLNSQEIADYINETFEGAVAPVFEAAAE